jgi:hypothetical protein
MTRLTIEQAKRLGIYPGESKYKSRKTIVDGITFDSQKEARKYAELKLLKQAGEILDYELQPQYELQPGYRDSQRNWVRPIIYRADFRVIYPDGREVIIDTKGHRTKEYLLKRKMLLYRYPNIEFREE